MPLLKVSEISRLIRKEVGDLSAEEFEDLAIYRKTPTDCQTLLTWLEKRTDYISLLCYAKLTELVNDSNVHRPEHPSPG